MLAEIEEAARKRPVFVKDMAYHAAGLLDADLLGRFRNCFLVRHPAGALRSLAARWPDFTDEETGWPHLHQAADVLKSLGLDLLVVDANRLCEDPARVVEAWCDQSGLDYLPEALTWEPGMRPEWELWEEWHASTTRTTGFDAMKPPPDPPGEDEPRLQEAYAYALPVYERLLAHAI